MIARRILCMMAVALAAGGGQAAFGRLGDTVQAVEQRYGLPISSNTLPGFTRDAYQKQGFEITIYYKDGLSVMETFIARGLDQATARQVAGMIAGGGIGSPDASEEGQIRQASGITSKDEVFWKWKSGGRPVYAAFNPLECTIIFFGDCQEYAAVHAALLSGQ